jgi:hypothetical protein
MSPNVLDNVDEAIWKMRELLVGDRMHDSQKIETTLRETLEYGAIWKHIDENQKIFAETTKFEGGFSVNPITKEGWKKGDFEVNGHAGFCRAIREIRNAVAHGSKNSPSDIANCQEL